jgi:hypothetical protein
VKSTHLLVGGVLVAVVAALALNRSSTEPPAAHREPDPAPQPLQGLPERHPAMPPDHPPTEGMPPGHPPVESMPPGHPPVPLGEGGAGSIAAPAVAEEGALTWKVPARWKETPNPSPMRLATYKIPGSDDAEVSVIRAGGSPEANLDRWVAQFDPAAKASAKRTTATVGGLRISRLDIRGTYLAGGGMMAGAPSEPRKEWALLGVVVETAGSLHFFKMTGPERAVYGARADMDALVASLARK